MKKHFSTEQIKEIASQLRKPHGASGIEVSDRMNDGIGPMNLHTLAVVNPSDRDNILEIGMGNGHFVKKIICQGSNISYTGLDYSEDMIIYAKDKNASLLNTGQVKFIHGNVQQMPFENNIFDTIFTVNTFYFWDEYSIVLQELKRVLKPTGKLIIAIRPKEVMDKMPFTDYGFIKKDHYEIIELLHSNDFKHIETTRIVEPERMNWGELSSRETVIYNCRLEAIES